MGGIGFIETNKAECMQSVLINTNLLRAARKHKVKRYFYSSSACVYHADCQSNQKCVSLKEADAYYNGGAMPEDGYGWEKLFSERMCRHFREDYGMETRVGRFHNIYGPHGSWNDGREKAPAALCRKVIEAKLNGSGVIDVWGNGTITRSFCWIDDCVEGILKLTDSGYHDPINIGSSELVTVNGLIDTIEEAAGYLVHRNYDMSKPQGVMGRNSDNTKIKEVLGWEPTTPLAEGIAKLYPWIEEQVKNAK
jgi:nucleoside-diphosphate-sugar epimerase